LYLIACEEQYLNEHNSDTGTDYLTVVTVVEGFTVTNILPGERGSRLFTAQLDGQSIGRTGWDCGEKPRSLCGVGRLPFVLNAPYNAFGLLSGEEA
jgi:hypothetical protein